MGVTMMQLDPGWPMHTPKGDAWAYAMVWTGQEGQVMFCTFLDADGSCWFFPNDVVKMTWNRGLGRIPPGADRWSTPFRPEHVPPKGRNTTRRGTRERKERTKTQRRGKGT